MNKLTANLSEDFTFWRHLDWRKAFVLAFFAVQLLLIVWARFASERYFCWAPHDCQTEYSLQVFVNGKELNDEEILKRYHRPRQYRDVRSDGNVKGWIIQESQTYGKNDDITVIMTYQVNGIPHEPWIWRRSPDNHEK